MKQMYGNIELEVDLEDCRSLVLSVGIDIEKNNEKYMPSLSMYTNRGHIDEKIVFIWDNDEYLYNILYKTVLIPWVDNNHIVDAKEFSEVIAAGIHLHEFAELKKIFDKAIEFEFFNHLIKDEDEAANS